MLTATVLTTEPNAEVRGVGHHRVPCVLRTAEDRRDWLQGGAVPLDPLPDGLLSSRAK